MTDLLLKKNSSDGAAFGVRKRSLLAPLSAALVLAGCMTQPVAPAPHAGVPVPASFSAGGDALPTAPWTVAAPAEAPNCTERAASAERSSVRASASRAAACWMLVLAWPARCTRSASAGS